MTRRFAALVLASVFGGAAALHGHHSVSGAYDVTRQLQFSAVITEFHFVNPHAFLMVAVTDDATRKSETWRLDMDNRIELAGLGMTIKTFKPGDRVIVHGSPARSQKRELYVRRLDRPADGFWYEQVGFSPRIGSAHRPS